MVERTALDAALEIDDLIPDYLHADEDSDFSGLETGSAREEQGRRSSRRVRKPPSAAVPIHALMRYSDKLYNIGDVIERHMEVLEREGAVWIGKLGRPLGLARMAKINDQVERGVPSYLYLTQKTGSRSETFRGSVVRMESVLPESETKLVPPYYFEVDLPRHIRFWTKVSEIEALDPGGLSELRILSSHERAPRTLSTSMAGLFIVYEDPDLRPAF